MGFLDFIGDLGTDLFRPLKNLTGIDASTSGVKFGTPFQKMTLGDVASLAGMFAAPGFKVSSIGDLGKLGTANFAKNFGTTSGLLGQAGLGDFKDIGKWQTKDFLTKGPALLGSVQHVMGQRKGGQGAPQGGGAGSGMDPRSRYEGALSRGYDALDPMNARRQVDLFQGQSDRRAKARGRSMASALRGKGLGRSAQAGAMVSAANQANDATNQFAMGLSSPESQARAYERQAALMRPRSARAYDWDDAEMQQMGNRIAAGRPPSDMERAFGVLGQLWGSGALDGLFDRGGGAEAGSGGGSGHRRKYGPNIFGVGLNV